ncbi:isoaspartyl peptidase/L-asparaginase family protein [Pantoea sp. 18069]|uniref:isoaspartyl peptidase/L-asparaginase family protein n=1 Tax=Pantoea sp. 18069 TaxID=2681415 RepID=UPI0013572069|nr:isoaspartyl peptidase/L-asparaginase [Pantoea sp. 18069]
MGHVPFVIAVHGGAGTMSPDPAIEAPYHFALKAALAAGAAVLESGGAALDAVQAAVVSLEDCPLFNAGRGSVYTADARHEMDAAVMDGQRLAAGAVACVHGVRNPVALARSVLEASGHVLMVGEGAQCFAQQMGLAMEPEAYFHTDERLAELRRVQQQRKPAGMQAPPQESGHFGTVGAVALDAGGHLAAAVSTGGLTAKRAGRVGDSAVIGAGIYANDLSCAVVATGTGEHFIRTAAAHDVHARMAYRGQTLQEAAPDVVFGELLRIGGRGGLIAVDARGEVSMPFNTSGMYRGVQRQGEAACTAIFQDEAPGR